VDRMCLVGELRPATTQSSDLLANQMLSETILTNDQTLRKIWKEAENTKKYINSSSSHEKAHVI
jgi:hypothetical protein